MRGSTTQHTIVSHMKTYELKMVEKQTLTKQKYKYRTKLENTFAHAYML